MEHDRSDSVTSRFKTNSPRPFIVLAYFCLLLPTGLLAQWSTDPTQNLIVGYGENPQIASDSAGGCYVSYEQYTGQTHLYLERLNRFGYRAWASRRQIMGIYSSQYYAKLVGDGQGGVIVSYLDLESSQIGAMWRLRVQRVDSAGNFLWGSTGVRVSISETNHGENSIVPDGTGGCIVAWVDTLSQLLMQRVNPYGQRMWGDSGTIGASDGTSAPVMVADRVGGIIMSWRYEKLQRINAFGHKVWPDTGITVIGGAGQLAMDDGGLVYARGRRFLGTRNGELLFTLTMHQLDTLATMRWGSFGTLLDTINTNSAITVSFAVEHGYSTVAWPQKQTTVWDLRAQIVRRDGNTVFPYGGIALSRVASRKGLFGVLPSDSSTSIFVWWDQRPSAGTYGQRLDTLGNAQWDTNDVAVSLPGSTTAQVTTDCSAGFIIVESMGVDFSIRAQQVSKYGNLGQVITSTDEHSKLSLPNELSLGQNYPNPFNSTTRIRFELPRRTTARLIVYNILGQRLTNILDGVQEAGNHTTYFVADNLPSGIYLYKLETPYGWAVRKLIIIK